MKKIVFTLVLLLFTAPAWATVTIDANQLVPGSNEVVITYFSDGNLPRGFGLDITVTEGNIVDCIPAMGGECTDSVRGFGIFPSTIVIDEQATPPKIVFPGNPVSTVQPALGGFDTNGITIELGSLYQEPNSPELGTESEPIVLCTIVITKSCIVRIAGNAARCGESSPAVGVVMEDWEEIPTVIFGDCNARYDEDCFPSDYPAYDDWVAFGKPGCWCGSGHPDANPRQCYGDADGLAQGSALFGYEYVGTDDLAMLIDAWRIKEPPKGPGISGNQICADFDHAQQGSTLFGFERVGTDDLAIMIDYWRIKEPPKGDGIPFDCPKP